MIVGVLGGGQLARMLALAGYPLGLRFRFLDPDPACPAGEVGELVVGKYDDEKALAQFVQGVDVVTYEFENVPVAAARWLTEHVPVFPPEGALATAQDRLKEKACFNDLGTATAKYRPAMTLPDLRAAVNAIGIPCIVKTVREGYDGKGQAAIRSDADVEFAWGMVSSGKPAASLVVEQFAQFRRELSMLGVRSRDGQMRFYPPTENVHVAGILARSTAPAPRCDDRTREAMEQATGKVLERLEYVGVLAVEFFEVGDGIVVANEMAPRVHNSGHWTIEGAECSQFENHIRAVAGLPLGSTAPRGYSIMLNVIGGEPDLRGLLSTSGVHVHMYGKTPRPGRKLGHVTVCETDAVKTSELAVRVAAMLRNC